MRKLKSKDPMPRRVQPMLAKLVSAPFSSEEWLFEPKLDGIRAIAYLRGGELTLLTRRGLDLSGRYPKIESALRKQKGDMILDGEIVALDASGRPSFQLESLLSEKTAAISRD